VTVESSKTNVEKTGEADSCTLYEAAPEEAAHVSVTLVGTVAPSAGLEGTGDGGGKGRVVSVQVSDHVPASAKFCPLTRQ